MDHLYKWIPTARSVATMLQNRAEMIGVTGLIAEYGGDGTAFYSESVNASQLGIRCYADKVVVTICDRYGSNGWFQRSFDCCDCDGALALWNSFVTDWDQAWKEQKEWLDREVKAGRLHPSY